MKIKGMNHIGLKIVSLFIAIILWLVVVNVDNPTITRTVVNIPVTPLNEQVITEENSVYRVVSGGLETIQVKGPRKIVDKLSASDFTATADFSKLSIVNAAPINVEAKESRINNSIEIVDRKNDAMIIEVEKVSSKRVPVEVVTSGKPANGYIVGTTNSKRSEILITAPVNTLNRVDKAVLQVDVSDATSQIKKKVKVRLYDNKDTEITSVSEVTMEVKKIVTTVNIDLTKKVPVQVGTSGTPAEGYSYQGIEISPKEVTIAGSPELVKTVETIEVANEDVSIEGWQEDKTVEVDLTKYIPEGLYIQKEKDKVIEVDVSIQPIVTKTIYLPVSQIEILNTPQGFTATLGIAGGMDVVLSGIEENLTDIEAQQLAARVDLSQCKKGNNTVTVVIDTPANVMIESELNINVSLNKAS